MLVKYEVVGEPVSRAKESLCEKMSTGTRDGGHVVFHPVSRPGSALIF